MTGGHRNHIDPLTSARFLAALYVLLHHSGSNFAARAGILPGPIETFFGNGYLGVSFFFILSGFILTCVYRCTLNTSHSLCNFAVARLARIYPVYLLGLGLAAPFAPGQDFLQVLPQFVLLQSWGPPALQGFANWNGPAWTLSVELFFYILFPGILASVGRLSTMGLVFGIVAASATMLAFRLPAIVGGQDLVWGGLSYVPLPMLRAPEFLYGALLGEVYARSRNRPVAPVVPCLIGALTAFLLCTSNSLWIVSFASVLFGLLILTIAGMRGGRLLRLLSSRAMVFLGGASYSLYILQTPVRDWIRYLFTGELELLGRAMFYPVLFGLAISAFLFYEDAAREWIRRQFAFKPEAGRAALQQAPARQA